MLEFAIGWLLGTSFTFLCILAGSLLKEDIYEEEKTSDKSKKYTEHKR